MLSWLFGKKKERTPYRNCTNCEHFREWREPDRLNPDKTVTKGHRRAMQCGLGKFELEDTVACPKFKELTYGTKQGIYIPPVPPKPPTGGSAVQRPKECNCGCRYNQN